MFQRNKLKVEGRPNDDEVAGMTANKSVLNKEMGSSLMRHPALIGQRQKKNVITTLNKVDGCLFMLVYIFLRPSGAAISLNIIGRVSFPFTIYLFVKAE